MLRFLPFVALGVLALYCLVEISQSKPQSVRHLPRWAWALLIIIVPLLGSLAWLLAGRPPGGPPRRPPRRPPPRPVAPDDNPEFLRGIGDQRTRDGELFRQWEEDLRRRERDMRDRGDGGSDRSDDRGSGQPDGDEPPPDHRPP